MIAMDPSRVTRQFRTAAIRRISYPLAAAAVLIPVAPPTPLSSWRLVTRG